LVLFSPSVFAKELKRDPETGVIRVIYIGMPFGAPSPYQVFKYDPLLSTLPIQGNLWGIAPSLIRRSMRLYMPRTQKDLVTKYDIIGLDDASYMSFPPQTIKWMRDGLIEDGLGIFMAGGFESFGGGAGFPSWDNTVLRDVLPVKCTEEYGPDGKNVVVDFEDEFIKSVPWDEYGQHNVFGGYNIVQLKQGANQLSKVIRLGMGGGEDPGWVWWDIGKGRFFASAPGLRGGSAGKGFIRWKNYPDFVSNMVYFLAGLKPPENIQLLHAVRARLRDIHDERQTIIGMIDFISKFGADTRKVDRALLEADMKFKEVKRYFVNLDLEKSKAAADQVYGILEEAYQRALEAKDAALFWIFVTEWLVVSATGLIVGSVLWALMVRRRLYREVGVTRGGV